MPILNIVYNIYCHVPNLVKAKRMDSSCSKTPNSLVAFEEGFLMAVWGRGSQVYDQLVLTSLIDLWESSSMFLDSRNIQSEKQAQSDHIPVTTHIRTNNTYARKFGHTFYTTLLLQQSDSYTWVEKWGQGPGGRKSHTFKQWGSMGRQRKTGNFRLTGSHTFGW